MITSYVISAYFLQMKTRLAGIPFYDKVIYSPTLDNTAGTVRRQYVGLDKALKDVSKNNNWVIIFWSREALKKSQYQARRFDMLTGMTNSKADTRISDISLSVNYTSSSPLMLESVEEAFLTFEPNFSFDVDMGEYGIIKASVNNFDTGSFTKEDPTTLGSLVTLSTTLTLTFPVLYNRLLSDFSLMSDVNATVKDIFNNLVIPADGTFLKLSTNENDAGAIGAVLTLYLLGIDNVVECLTVMLDATNTTIPIITTKKYLKVFGVMSDKDIQKILSIKTFNDVTIWEGTLTKGVLYGCISPNNSTDAKGCIVKVSANIPILGSIVVHGIGISGVERYEVVNFLNSKSGYTKYNYSSITQIFVGNGALATYSVKVESSYPIIERVNFSIYNYLPKL